MNRLLSATATLLVIIYLFEGVKSQAGLRIPPQLLFEFLRSMPRDPAICNFACPLGTGTAPSPRSAHVPRFNGCGSYGFERLLIPETEPFIECCNAHDICYDTCGVSKHACDLQFQYCLNHRCNRISTSPSVPTDFRQNMRAGGLLHTCLSTARLLSSGPQLAGCGAYMAAQNSACVCV